MRRKWLIGIFPLSLLLLASPTLSAAPYDVVVTGFHGGGGTFPPTARTVRYANDGTLQLTYPITTWPSQIATKPDGELSLSTELSSFQPDRYVIQRFTSTGLSSGYAIQDTAPLSGVAISSDGTLFTVRVGGNGNHSQLLRLTGGIVTTDVRSLPIGLNPAALELIGCGLYYAAANSHDIYRLDVCSTTPAAPFAVGLPGAGIVDIAAANDGTLLVATVDRLLAIDTTGTVTKTYTVPGLEGILSATPCPPSNNCFLALAKTLSDPSKAVVVRFDPPNTIAEHVFDVPASVVERPTEIASAPSFTSTPVPALSHWALLVCACLLVLLGSRLIH